MLEKQEHCESAGGGRKPGRVCGIPFISEGALPTYPETANIGGGSKSRLWLKVALH